MPVQPYPTRFPLLSPFRLTWLLLALSLVPDFSWASSAGNSVPSAPNTTGLEEIESSSKDLRCGQECLYKRANENVLLQTAYSVIKYNKLQALPDDAARARELGAYCAPAEGSGACYERYVREAQRALPELRGSASRSLGQIEKLQENSDRTLPVARPATPGSPNGAPPGMMPYLPTLEQVKTQYDRDHAGGLDPRTVERHQTSIANPPRPEDFAKMKEDVLPDGTKLRRPERRQDGSIEIDQQRYQAAMKAWQEGRKGLIGDDQKAALEASKAAAKDPGLRKLDLEHGGLSATDREAFLESRGLFFDALDKKSGGSSLSSGRTPSSNPSPRAGADPRGPAEADLTSATQKAVTSPRRMENGVLQPGKGSDTSRDLNVEYPLDPVDRFIDGMNAP